MALTSSVTTGVKVLEAGIVLPGLPQTATEEMASVSGLVLITSIVGTVDTVIQAQANDMQLIANPNTGADTDLFAATDINGLAADSMIAVTGTLADTADTGLTGAGEAMAAGIVVNAGGIDMSCAASSTGAISWIIHYIPLVAGATITASTP